MADTHQGGRKDSFAAAAQWMAAQRPIPARLGEIASLFRTKGPAVTEVALRSYLRENEDDADALRLLAQAVDAQGRRREAHSLLARTLTLAPDFIAARYAFAKLLFQLNRFPEALEEVNLLRSDNLTNPLFRELEASILEQIGEGEGAVSVFAELSEENPGRTESWLRYAHALQGIGQQQESAATYRRAIATGRALGGAYWGIANMKAVWFTDNDVAAMEQALRRKDVATDSRAMIQFALGKAFEDRGDYSRAWEQFARANAALRLRITYDPSTIQNGVARNKLLFTAKFFKERSDWGCRSREPVFIVGRQRSGSTLVEQILASHSAVEGTGELPYIPALAERLENRDHGPAFGTVFLNVLATCSSDQLQTLGEDYLQRAGLHRKLGRPFFIDKKPGNFIHVGTLQLIFPNARIIDVRRHPAACNLSMFKHYSSSRLRLDELGMFYRSYVELMAHFDRVLPGRIHRVLYEDLVANPEQEVRRLLDYVGLPFEEGCLRFYETKRAILTPSAEQVRKPLSDTAVDFWRNYQPWLGALLQSLGSVGTEYPHVPAELSSN